MYKHIQNYFKSYFKPYTVYTFEEKIGLGGRGAVNIKICTP